MRIQSLYHACFLITTDAGTRIVTDPFNEEVGYPAPNVEADLALCSHNHYDHHAVDQIKGTPALIDTPGQHVFRGIKIFGVSTYHDHEKGKKRGSNIIFIIETDGMRLAHCGDLGHVLSPEQVKSIGDVDILLIPVGGTYTIDAVEATAVVQQLKPKAVIPMHYKTDMMNFPIKSVDEFLKQMGKGERIPGNSIVFDAGSLPKELGVYVLF
jgi:L-ascorbate metabolism protein UlaG (beta-lactamase superfamily)